MLIITLCTEHSHHSITKKDAEDSVGGVRGTARKQSIRLPLAQGNALH